jgi:Family of unknown function (DUF6498)
MSTAQATPSNSGIALALVFSNALTLGFALWQDWSLGMLLWPYWLQSLLIGGFAVRRILALQSFSTEGFRFGNQRVSEDSSGQRKTAAFFAVHFGFFHFVYFIFLVGMAPLSMPGDLLTVAACALAFGLAQRQTFRQQLAADARGRPNLGLLMFLPYLRIVPMHLTITLGMGLGPLLPLFVFIPLKALADIGLDLADRRLSQKSMLDWLKAREPRPPDA